MTKLNKAGAALVGLLAATCSAQAASPDDRIYGFVDGFIVHHEERIPQRDRSAGVRVGLGFPLSAAGSRRTGLEFSGFTNPIKRKNFEDEQQNGVMLDLVTAWDMGRIDPFLSAGLGGVEEYAEIYPAAEITVGTLVGFGEGSALRLAVSGQSVYDDEIRAGKDQFVDYRAVLGFAVPFGEATPPPPPVIDSDGDGVPDPQDRCPAQPAPTADGCPAPVVPAEPPRDTDGDGIEDSKDECPGTLEGLQADANGCVSVTASAAPQQVVLKGVTFVSGSAELAPNAKTVLDVAYDALAGQTNLRVELGGHTDSSGDDKMNQKLSQRRADSVRKYLTVKGIAGDRLVAKGYGEAQPIADNKTKEGRQENRRVVFKILN